MSEGLASAHASRAVFTISSVTCQAQKTDSGQLPAKSEGAPSAARRQTRGVGGAGRALGAYARAEGRRGVAAVEASRACILFDRVDALRLLDLVTHLRCAMSRARCPKPAAEQE